MTMAEARQAFSVALLDMPSEHASVPKYGCDPKMHRCTRFATAPALLSALGYGQRFDLLLAASQGDVTSACLAAVCEALRIPAFVLHPQKGWSCLWPRTEVMTHDSNASIPAMMDAGLVLRARMPMAHFSWKDYQFRPEIRTVVYGGREIPLQPRQFEFALALFQHAGEVLTREWLWSSIWKRGPRDNETRAVDVCAASLRKLLDLNLKNGLLLRAVYGTGYQLVEVQPPQ